MNFVGKEMKGPDDSLIFRKYKERENTVEELSIIATRKRIVNELAGICVCNWVCGCLEISYPCKDAKCIVDGVHMCPTKDGKI